MLPAIQKTMKKTNKKLLVSKDGVFFSLQGEGPTMGKPAIFLRLQLCNLHCAWCDTKHTWNSQDGESWSITKTVIKLGRYMDSERYRYQRIVITGGEPLLQSDAIDELLGQFCYPHRVEIETNGTISPSQAMISDGVRFNVSPKLENSGNLKESRYAPAILQVFNEVKKTSFKFVVTGPKDIAEIERIVRECDLDSEKIILMPEGRSQEAISKHGKAVAEICKEKGWQLIPRLQVMLWGDERKK